MRCACVEGKKRKSVSLEHCFQTRQRKRQKIFETCKKHHKKQKTAQMTKLGRASPKSKKRSKTGIRRRKCWKTGLCRRFVYNWHTGVLSCFGLTLAPVTTCENLRELARTCENLRQPARTCENFGQNGSVLHLVFQIGKSWPKVFSCGKLLLKWFRTCAITCLVQSALSPLHFVSCRDFCQQSTKLVKIATVMRNCEYLLPIKALLCHPQFCGGAFFYFAVHWPDAVC